MRNDLVWIRWLDPKKGDQHQEMAPLEAVDLIMKQRDEGRVRFGVWEGGDRSDEEKLELEMATRTGILDALKKKAGQTLRLVPLVAGG